MAYNVGQVEVSVLPNAERFNEDLAAKLNPRAREIGRDMGDQIADGIRERLALLGDVNIGVDTTKAGLEVDKFLAETDVKAKLAGDEAGRSLGDNLAKSAAGSGKGASPMIVAAVAGGLLAGAPLLLGAAGILFGGIAAAAVHSNAEVAATFAATKTQIEATFTSAAQVTVPMFVSALQRIGTAVQGLGPELHTAFAALGGPLDSLTTGVVKLMQNAMPGLVAAVQAAGPVFQGLASLMASIGTGVGQLFQIISQHAGTAGQVFKSLGDIIGELLPALGQLMGAGSDLGATILPVLAGALGLVAKTLSAIAPVLPAVVAGFLAFKIAGALSGPLNSLSTSLGNVGTAGSTVSKMATGAGTAISGLGRALPVVGVALSVMGAAWAQAAAQVDQFKQAAEGAFEALHAGGPAADLATQHIAALKQMAAHSPDNFLGLGTDLAAALKSAEKAAREAYNAMTPLEKKQQDVAAATATLQAVLADPHHTAAQAAAASDALAGKQAVLTGFQSQLATATDAAMTAGQRHQKVLQDIANAAGAGTTQINLLKGALDALTGKAVTADEAQIAVTNAVIAATTATKGQTGALIGANGQLDLSSAKGAAASQALINLSNAGHTQIATLEGLHGSTAQVSALTDSLRAQFIKSAEQMNINADEAKRLADRYFGIPKDVHTRVEADTAPALNAIDSVLTALARVRDKTVTITTVTAGYHVSGANGQPGGTQVAGAIGGIVHPYASGGIEPMKGGIAQIVPPNALRVIGDRVTDDEAYIPINRDLRSIAIWRQAGQRMGQLSAVGAGGGGSAHVTANVRVYVGNREITDIARVEADAAVGQAFNYLTDRGNYNP